MEKLVFDEYIRKSAAVIAGFQEESGAYPASPNFANYRYTWFRDGSFTADAMSRAGDIESAERFFAWGSKVVTDRRDLILEGGRLYTRYTYEGQEVTDEWANFQLDGFGVFLWALKQHAVRHNRSVQQYQDAAGLLQHYLVTHWHEPCFDWWEEREGVHAATLACVYAGLKAYEHPEAETVKRTITLDGERTDASLLVCGFFDAVNQESFAPTLSRIEETLLENGGVYRYADDTYYGGGQWPVLSGLLGLYYVNSNRIDDAKKQLEWCITQIGVHDWIPEQAQTDMLHPESYGEWVEKAGIPAAPLLWSHAMTITLASRLNEVS